MGNTNGTPPRTANGTPAGTANGTPRDLSGAVLGALLTFLLAALAVARRLARAGAVAATLVNDPLFTERACGSTIAACCPPNLSARSPWRPP